MRNLLALLATALFLGGCGGVAVSSGPSVRGLDDPVEIATIGDNEVVSSGGRGESAGDGISTIPVVPAAGNTIDGRLDLSASRSVAVGGSPDRVALVATADGVSITVRGAENAFWFLDGDQLTPPTSAFAPGFAGQPRVTDALPDGVVVPFGDVDERFVVLAEPTQEYGHAVLGDDVEAGAVVVVDRSGEEQVRLRPVSGRVIEQRLALVTELDGEEAVVVTTSSPEDGARVEVWSLESERRAIGPAIGVGGRWRHVVGVSGLPDGGIEIAEVITPHLDKVASFLRVDGDRLVQVDAVRDSIASHQIGSRVLDRAALVDVDGDGRRDLVGPAADDDGIAWVVAGGDVPEHAMAGQRVVTNLALASRPDGTVVLAYATSEGTLVILG